jgi:hypothetical protein
MKQILNKFDAGHLESEISKDGIGSDFYAAEIGLVFQN